MKRTIPLVTGTIIAVALCSPVTATAAPSGAGCSYYVQGQSVHATCTNATSSILTANLYADCQPNWHNPHVTKPVSPGETVSLSTKCGGWSKVKGASAYIS